MMKMTKNGNFIALIGHILEYKDIIRPIYDMERRDYENVNPDQQPVFPGCSLLWAATSGLVNLCDYQSAHTASIVHRPTLWTVLMLKSHRTLILDDDIPNWRSAMIWPRVSLLEMSRLRAMMALTLNF